LNGEKAPWDTNRYNWFWSLTRKKEMEVTADEGSKGGNWMLS
jgi:hypothetical protein